MDVQGLEFVQGCDPLRTDCLFYTVEDSIAKIPHSILCKVNTALNSHEALTKW